MMRDMERRLVRLEQAEAIARTAVQVIPPRIYADPVAAAAWMAAAQAALPIGVTLLAVCTGIERN